MRINLQDKKLLNIIEAKLDVRINAMGLKIRRLENDRNSQRGKIIRLENEVQELKQKLNKENNNEVS